MRKNYFKCWVTKMKVIFVKNTAKKYKYCVADKKKKL